MLSKVIKLISSSFAGQIINLLVLLVIARLVLPNVYGSYTVSLIIVTYIVNFASAKYQHAIFTLNDQDADKLVNGARIFCFLISIICAISLIVVNSIFEIWSNIIWYELLLIGLAGYFSSINLFYYYLAIKRERLKSVITSRVLSPLIGGSIMLLLVYTFRNSTSLLVGYTITLFIANIFISNKFCSFKLVDLIDILKSNIKLPALLLPSGFLETMNASYLIFATSANFGPEGVAYVGMYLRLIASPQGMVSTAISDTLRNEFAKITTVEKSVKLFFRALFFLLLIASFSSLGIYLFTHFGLVRVLGSNWEQAEVVFYSFIPLFFATFIVSPVTSILYVRDGQKYDLLLQITLMLMLAFYHFQYNAESIQEFVIGYSLVMTIKYLLELALCYRCLVNRTALTTQ